VSSADDRTFDLSGVIVTLRGAPADLAAAFTLHWSAFRSHGGAACLDVTLREGAGPFGSGPALAATLVDDGEPVRYATPAGAIAVDRAGRAELVLAAGPARERIHDVVNLVLAALANVAPAHGALLLHAAGIVVDGSGFVLLGPAGSGKSTWLALVAGAAQPISDDLVGVDTRGPTIHVLALPFRRSPDCRAGPGRWPLGALLLPAHGPLPRLDPVDPRVARAAVVANLPHLAPARRVAGATATVVERILRDVAVRRLTFARDARFLDLLRPLAAGAPR